MTTLPVMKLEINGLNDIMEVERKLIRIGKFCIENYLTLQAITKLVPSSSVSSSFDLILRFTR